MKMAANETELRNALKEKTQEITIVTSYADKVMERYGADLTAFINPAVAALVAGPLRLGLARYLQWYKIQSYTKGNLVIERKFL
jgi:hypothetical protein